MQILDLTLWLSDSCAFEYLVQFYFSYILTCRSQLLRSFAFATCYKDLDDRVVDPPFNWNSVFDVMPEIRFERLRERILKKKKNHLQ